MSDQYHDCQHFEDLLVSHPSSRDLDPWQPHLAECPNCRGQLSTHQMLLATWAEVAVPELSPAFEVGLQRKLDAAVEIRPLRGWRMAAMLGYALMAAGLLRWTFASFPLPSITLDPASPWILSVALVAVPLTLWLAIGATRWLPTKGWKGLPHLSLL